MPVRRAWVAATAVFSLLQLSSGFLWLPMLGAQMRAHEVAKSQERTNWRNLPAEQLTELIITSALAYGLAPSAKLLQSNGELYAHFVKRITLNERVETVVLVGRKIEKELSAARSLEPFIYYDSAFAVVSSATLKLAVLMPLERGDEMTGPRHVCQIMRSVRSDETRGQILAGLLVLGDQRVMPIVRECFHLLGLAGRKQLAAAWTGFAYKSTVDFLVDWLEDSLGREDEFGSVAGTLGRLAIQARPRRVLDLRRRFPANAGPEDQAIVVTHAWGIREYGQIIAPRLRAVAKLEREPRVVPLVMDAWGIE